MPIPPARPVARPICPSRTPPYGGVSPAPDAGCGQEDTAVVELLSCNVAVLAIAALYYAWKDRRVKVATRRQVLRQRVAYLLWAAAERG